MAVLGSYSSFRASETRHKMRLLVLVLYASTAFSFRPGARASYRASRARQLVVKSEEDDGWGAEATDELKLEAAAAEVDNSVRRARGLERIALERAKEEAILEAREAAKNVAGFEDLQPIVEKTNPLEQEADRFIPLLVGVLGGGSLLVFGITSIQSWLASLSEVSY